MLKVGDIVCYYECPGTAGDPDWLRTDTITAVVRDEFPLRFLHGCPYHPDGLMKKVPPGYSTPPSSEAGSDDESIPTDIKFRVLSQYHLVYGGTGQACGRIIKNDATIKDVGVHVAERTIAGDGGIVCKDLFNYRKKQVN